MQTPYGAATGAESALSTTQKVMLVLVFGAALYGLHVAAGGFEPEPAHARRRVPHTVAPPKPSRLPNRRKNGRHADDVNDVNVWSEVEQGADGTWSWFAVVESDAGSRRAGPAMGYATRAAAERAMNAWVATQAGARSRR